MTGAIRLAPEHRMGEATRSRDPLNARIENGQQALFAPELIDLLGRSFLRPER